MTFPLLQSIIANAMEWAVILLPLMLYLLVLGLGVNRSRHPVAVRGHWNMVGLLLGLSGFLLIGPPTWTAHFFKSWGWFWYGVAYVGYLTVLGFFCVWLIRRQRRVLVIYNIDPAIFAEVLQEVLSEVPVPHTATPGRMAFSEGRAIMDIEALALLHNVSLRWRGEDDSVRESVEQRLMQTLPEVESGHNPSTGILTLAACFIGVFIVFAVALYLALYHFPLPPEV